MLDQYNRLKRFIKEAKIADNNKEGNRSGQISLACNADYYDSMPIVLSTNLYFVYQHGSGG